MSQASRQGRGRGDQKKGAAIQSINFDDAMQQQQQQQQERGGAATLAVAAGQTPKGSRQRDMSSFTYNPFALQGMLRQPRPSRFPHRLDQLAYDAGLEFTRWGVVKPQKTEKTPKRKIKIQASANDAREDLRAMRPQVVGSKPPQQQQAGRLQLDKHPNRDAIGALLPPSWFVDHKVTNTVYLRIYEILGKKDFENIFITETIPKSRSVFLRFRV